MLVSCIMPTRNRREFIPRAIAQFFAQDWPEKELVILDNGDDCVADLIPHDPRIMYMFTDMKTNLGHIRNLCCGMAQGDIICHFDDDDWQATDRITKQVNTLLSGDFDICGLRDFYFRDCQNQKAWLYRCPGIIPLWIFGGTFGYWKRYWQAHPFNDADHIGEDNYFIWNNDDIRIAVMDDKNIFLATVHDNNTDFKRVDNACYQPIPIQELPISTNSSAFISALG